MYSTVLYDEYTIKQINRNIELIRYKMYEDDLIMFELVNTIMTIQITDETNSTVKTITKNLEQADQDLKDLYYSIEAFILNLGDDIEEKVLKHYIAFKKITNFASIEIYPKSKIINIHQNVNPDEVELIDGSTRDVRNMGHYGTGKLEVRIEDKEDFERAKNLILKSYST